MRYILFIMAGLVFVSTSVCFAGRPLGTNDAVVVEKGYVEIETGLEYINQTDKETALSVCITRGIFDNLNVAVEVPYKFIDFAAGSKTDGFDDVSFSAKYNFLQEDVWPAMAVNWALKSDSGNDEKSLGTGAREYAVDAIISKSFDKMTTHVNLGYVFKEDLPDANLRDVLTYAFAVEYPLDGKLTLVGEITGENERRGNFDSNVTAGLLGVNYLIFYVDMGDYLPKPSLIYDIGIGFEISEASPDFKVTTGFTFEI